MTHLKTARLISLADYLMALPKEFPLRLAAHIERCQPTGNEGKTVRRLLTRMEGERGKLVTSWPLLEDMEESAETWIRDQAGNAAPFKSVPVTCPRCEEEQTVYHLQWTKIKCRCGRDISLVNDVLH